MNLKVIGYAIAVLGLLILVVGAGGFGFPEFFSSVTMNIAGMVAVGLGVVLVVMAGGGSGRARGSKYEGIRKSKDKGKLTDLPIYEGEQIVAYRRD